MKEDDNPNKNSNPDDPTKKNLHSNRDNSNNSLNNQDKVPLQESKKEKNTKQSSDPTNNKIVLQSSLNGRTVYFNMRFKSLLDELRKNRQDNEEKRTNSHYKNVRNYLDKATYDHSKNRLSLITIDKPVKDTDLDDLLKAINREYDDTGYDRSMNILLNKISKNDKLIESTRALLESAKKPCTNPMRGKGLIIHDRKRHSLPARQSKPRREITPSIVIKKKKVTIDREINGLGDILKLIKDYPLKEDVEYNIDMKTIHNIKKPLEDLNGMIGMHKLKDSIVDQIIYFIQGLNNNTDFMHTVIYGPPGTGKTEVAKIMGSIFSSLGVLKNNKFRKVTRVDLIAGYLGQTAIKTRNVISDCLGGVLFIDEAYALGNRDKKDSFAKECIDTLCESLSSNKSKLMVIIAGYEDDLKKCFFAYNQGLDSRFPWRFNTDDYTAKELKLIFCKKVKDINWSVKDPLQNSWFETKMDYFKFFGRDMETLLAKTKIAHCRRVFCKSEKEKKVLTMGDIDKGFELFLENHEVKSRGNKDTAAAYMYI